MQNAEPHHIDRLPPIAWQHLNAFVTGADREALEQGDWLVFYEFVKSCHIHEAKFAVEALVEFLGEQGFRREATIELGLVYAHGRALLANRGTPGPRLSNAAH